MAAGFMDMFIDGADDSVIIRSCWGFRTLVIGRAAGGKASLHHECSDWTDPSFTSSMIKKQQVETDREFFSVSIIKTLSGSKSVYTFLLFGGKMK